MAVSKRLRFEILRRDNFSCQYCGSSAPSVQLSVDHIVAVSLGGSDKPSNLVACCVQCNFGKSSTIIYSNAIEDESDNVLILKFRRDIDQFLGRGLTIEELDEPYRLFIELVEMGFG